MKITKLSSKRRSSREIAINSTPAEKEDQRYCWEEVRIKAVDCKDQDKAKGVKIEKVRKVLKRSNKAHFLPQKHLKS